jgi:hypothetical protein
MPRHAWIIIALLAAGCGSTNGNVKTGAEGQPAGGAQAGEQAAEQRPKTRFIGTMMKLLDNVSADTEKKEDREKIESSKDQVRESLSKADKQLQGVLGENSREAIVKANRKPLIPAILPYLTGTSRAAKTVKEKTSSTKDSQPQEH